MTATDTRGPVKNQRLIQLENVGSVEIPPWGACEITGSYRPEPLLTVYQVQRSEQADPCAHLVNFSCAIPVGQRGRPGTMDSPMKALVDTSLSVGTPVGIEENTFELQEHRCGYVILGDINSIEGTARVARYDNCPHEMMVRATECILPGEGGTAQPQKFSVSDFVDDESRSTIEVCDPLCWLLALPGEKFEVKRDHCTDHCWRPSHPFGLKRRVKVEYEIDCNASGTVTIMEHSTGSWSESICTIVAHNLSNRKIACDADEEATLIITEGDCTGWLIPDQRALRATAGLTADMCSGTGAITNIDFKDVCNWEPRVPVESVANPIGQLACANKVVELGWNDFNCAWDVVNVQPQVYSHLMFDMRCGTGCGVEYEKTKASVAVQQCESCDEKEWVASSLLGQYVDIPTTYLDCVGEDKKLVRSSVTVCVLCADGTSPSPVDYHPLTEIAIPESWDTEYIMEEGVEGEEGHIPEQCKLILKRRKYYALACDPDEDADDLVLDLDKVSPVVAVELEQDNIAETICTTATVGAYWTIKGCSAEEEDMESSCLETVDCDEEEVV